MRRVRSSVWIIACATSVVLAWIVARQAPMIAAGGLLHPARHVSHHPVPPRCEQATFRGHDVNLIGWRCAASQTRRATVIYLHGIADSRASALGAIQRYTAKGFDVIAYDSRAHGESEGTACTYGYYEKLDLSRVIDTLDQQPIVVIGTSLGAAVAIQAAAQDSRISAVVGAETFSDLRTIAGERAPILPAVLVDAAFDVAEKTARFVVDDVSPVLASVNVNVPMLLIHGAADLDTRPDHSQRVFAALAGPKRLILVEGARHNETLRSEKVWADIDAFIEEALPRE